MNLITRENEQAMLHEHYNNANRHFQAGDFTNALKELQEALRYAEDDKQVAHIQQTIQTVKDAMPAQTAGPAVAAVRTEPSEATEAPSAKPALPANNKLLMLTVLVGLICLTPIVMKGIEIFSQPSVSTEENAVPVEGTETSSSTASVDPAATTPSATPDVIVDAATTPVAATGTITGSTVNMRAEASTAAAAVARLSNGETVTILESNAIQSNGYTWSKVQTSAGATGWIASQFIQAAAPVTTNAPVNGAAAPVDSASVPVDPAVNTSTAPADATAVGTSPESPAAPVDASTTAPVTPDAPARSVTGNGVALRAAPSKGGALLTTLSPSQITVLQDKAVTADGLVWTKIRTPAGTEGWIADQFLSN